MAGLRYQIYSGMVQDQGAIEYIRDHLLPLRKKTGLSPFPGQVQDRAVPDHAELPDVHPLHGVD